MTHRHNWQQTSSQQISTGMFERWYCQAKLSDGRRCDASLKKDWPPPYGDGLIYGYDPETGETYIVEDAVKEMLA